MKTYYLQEGAKFTLETETSSGRIVSQCVADRSIAFHEEELIEVDTVTKELHFKYRSRHYYCNNDDIRVIN